MLRSRYRSARWAAFVAMTAQTFLAPIASAGWPFRQPEPTKVVKLARSIDKLEKHLDEFGTIVAKSPDVWGEARLTKHRAEYEEVLKEELREFAPTINASIERSDRAFLASSLAIAAAVNDSPSSPPAMPPAAPSPPPPPTRTDMYGIVYDGKGGPLNEMLNLITPNTVTSSSSSSSSSSGSSSSPSVSIPSFVDPPTGPAASAFVAGTSSGVLSNFEQEKIALEPTLMLDQLSTYVNHLQALRRINDGDDKSDAPGYGLHLVHIPVSVLPGKKTREGYGAEISVIAKPHLHEDLLPETFRALVINDLADQFSFPVAKYIDNRAVDAVEEELDGQRSRANEAIVKCDAAVEQVQKNAAEFAELVKAYPGQGELAALVESDLDLATRLNNLAISSREALRIAKEQLEILGQLSLVESVAIPKEIAAWGELLLETPVLLDNTGAPPAPTPIPHPIEPMVFQATRSWDDKLNSFSNGYSEVRKTRSQTSISSPPLAMIDRGMVGPAVQLPDSLDTKLSKIASTVTASNISVAPSRRSRLPFPMTQVLEVYCRYRLIPVVEQALKLRDSAHNQDRILLLDLQKFFLEELGSAYELLKHENDLFDTHCTQQLVDAVHRHDDMMLRHLCDAFFCDLKTRVNDFELDASKESDLSIQHTGVLAWAIIVESALLNERLVEDMQLLAKAKNAYSLQTHWMPYFGCNPPLEARQAFNDYVACRWPIQVMAIQPVTNDQNVADRFSQQRELQLALTAAVASGELSAQKMFRYARQLELNMETIALNRTSVGFSHGDDTFGWRFYPRVQSPDTESNLENFARTAFLGGPSRDCQLKDRRLEPGIRECTAVVIMPSFVPYVIFDTRVNWFKLTDPSAKKLDMVNSVQLSEEIVQMRELSCACKTDAHLYRNNDLHRLNRAVDQLDRRLPMQTKYVQMPFENSLGGFEFFNTGTPDLAPELRGFYGEPGIRVESDPAQVAALGETSIFLVGDHFSVHETQVIVGNRKLSSDQVHLLSRQIMQIEIPANVYAVDDQVDIHVSTPYGVSNHILVPVIDPASAATEAAKKVVEEHVAAKHTDAFAWSSKEAVIEVEVDGQNVTGVAMPQAVTVINQSPTPFAGESGMAKLGVYVQQQLKDKDKPEDNKTAAISADALDWNLDTKTGTMRLTVDQNVMAQLLVTTSGRPKFYPIDNVEKLVLTGFVKSEGDDISAPSEVSRIDEELTLTIKVRRKDCCPTGAVINETELEPPPRPAEASDTGAMWQPRAPRRVPVSRRVPKATVSISSLTP